MLYNVHLLNVMMGVYNFVILDPSYVIVDWFN